MIHLLWVVVVCLCKHNCMTEMMWLVQTQSVYYNPGNLKRGFTRIFRVRFRQTSISFWEKPDLVGINIPDPSRCPLLWLLCHYVSVTNKLNGVSCSPRNGSASPAEDWLIFPIPAVPDLFKVTFRTFKLTASWELARRKAKRKKMKSMKFELDFENRFLSPWKFILATNLHKLV